ncbi:MAG TPA: hypothetical protein VKF62_13035 [Planctomycetota bacterium]|nr:hypothetical protein [Planctomycetota bacterium]
MTEPGPSPAGPRIGATLLGLGAVLVVLGGLAFYGARLYRRMLLDSADPGRQRALLRQVLGREQPPEGWRVGRAFDLPTKRVLLFVGLGGNPPVNVTGYVGDDAGEETAQTWIRSEAAPPPGAAFELRDVRRLSRSSIPTSWGEVPFAVIEGEDRQGLQRRAVYDLRGSPLPLPVDVQVCGTPGAPLDLEVAARFVRGLFAPPTSAPGAR